MMKLLQKALRPGATALVAMLLIGSFASRVRANVVVDPNEQIFVCPSFVSCSAPFAAPITALPADGSSSVTVSLTLLDTTSQPVGGHVVSMTGTGTINFPTQTQLTDPSGHVSFLITAPSLTTGTSVFVFADETDSVSLTNQVSLDFKNVSSATTVSFPQGSAFADDNSAVTVAVHALDLGDGPLSGADVQVLDVDPNGNIQTLGPIQTNAAGDLLQNINVTSLVSGTHVLYVYVDGVLVNTGAYVPFYPVPTVTVSPAAPADGVSQVTETVTLYDVDGTELQSGLINGSFTAPNMAAVTASPANINNIPYQAGGTSFSFASTVAQQVQVQLFLGMLPIPVNGAQTATLDFTPVAPPSLDVAVTPANGTVAANGVDAFTETVSVTDSNGNVMPNADVTFTVSNAADMSALNVGATTVVQTDLAGVATFTLTSTLPQTVMVDASAFGQNVPQYMATFVAPVADANSFVDVAPSSVPADGTPATVKVLLTDANGIAIPNQMVTVGYDLNGSQFSNWGTTDLSGAVSIDVSSTMVGTVALDVTANGVLLNTHPTVDFTPAPIDFTGSAVTVSPATLPGDNTTQATVTATVVDTNGQPVSGQPVVFDMTIGAYHVYAVGQHVTDAAGIATATFTYGSTGHATFTASANGQTFAQMPVATFIGSAAPSAPYSTVTAAPAMVPADGTTPVTVKVHAGNTGFLPMVNQFVTLMPDANAPVGLDINASNGGWTDVNGDVIFTVTSPNGGDATFTATVDNGLVPVTLAQTATATFVGLLPPVTVDAVSSTVDAQPSSVPADGVTTSLVTVTVIDANTSVGAAGQIVSLAEVSGLSGVTISANNAGVTDANGMVTFTVIGTTIGQADLAATVNGVTLNKTALTFTQIPPNAAQSKMSVYPTSLMPNSGNPAVVTVALVDQFGNAVANYPVDLVLTNVPAGMTVTASPALSALSDAQGAATFTLTADTVGSFDIAVSANGLMIGSSVTINVQTMHQGHSDMTVSPATLPADGTSTAILTVTARDAQGVAIVGQQIVLSGGGLGVTVVGNGVTDQSGVALYMISSTNAGTVVFSAKMGSVLFSQTATINFTSTGNSGQIGGGSSGGSSGGGGNFSAAPPAAPAPKVLGAHTGELVKIASNSAVYFVATDGKRHAFPNEKVYFTWYQNFDDVVTISDAEMAALPLGTNVTYRPGTRMVKFQSLAKVYVVGKGGELRWVGSESLAASLYGAHWAKMVDDVSDAFYVNYHFGADVTEVTGFNPATETAAVPTIDENI